MINVFILLYYIVICVVALIYDPSCLVTFTCWVLVLQSIYFLISFLHSIWIDNRLLQYSKKILLNMIGAPTLFLLFYWFFPTSLPFMISFAVHGINVAIVVYFIYKEKSIGQLEQTWLNIVLPIIPCVAYLIFAITYTYTTKQLIYPLNFFAFESIEGQPSYAVTAILVSSYAIAAIQSVLWYLCSED